MYATMWCVGLTLINATFKFHYFVAFVEEAFSSINIDQGVRGFVFTRSLFKIMKNNLQSRI